MASKTSSTYAINGSVSSSKTKSASSSKNNAKTKSKTSSSKGHQSNYSSSPPSSASSVSSTSPLDSSVPEDTTYSIDRYSNDPFNANPEYYHQHTDVEDSIQAHSFNMASYLDTFDDAMAYHQG